MQMREAPAPSSTSRPLVLASVVITIMLAGTLWLWANYGTAVFFETLRAGFIACFG
jgi:hypothetical protein